MSNPLKCIYSLKSVPNATFNSQEHIIPACIGGKKRLPHGYVSDEVNALFSKLELSFARKTEIAQFRAFYGPGKSGSLTFQNATESEIHIIENIDGGNIRLGYIKLGVPYSADCIFIDKNSGNVGISLRPREDTNNDRLLANFVGQIKAFSVDKPINIITSDRLNDYEYILGIHNNKQYIAYNPTYNIETVKQEMIRFVSAFVEQMTVDKINEMCQGANNPEINSSQVTMDMTATFNLNDRYRVLAKIALNSLAYLRGQDFVLTREFDPIRKAIYSGEGMAEYFDQMSYQESFGDILRDSEAQIEQKILSDHYHCISFFSALGKQKCAVELYGSDRPHIINLAETIKKPVFDVFICDWRTEVEMNLIDYITSFHMEIDKSN